MDFISPFLYAGVEVRVHDNELKYDLLLLKKVQNKISIFDYYSGDDMEEIARRISGIPVFISITGNKMIYKVLEPSKRLPVNESEFYLREYISSNDKLVFAMRKVTVDKILHDLSNCLLIGGFTIGYLPLLIYRKFINAASLEIPFSCGKLILENNNAKVCMGNTSSDLFDTGSERLEGSQVIPYALALHGAMNTQEVFIPVVEFLSNVSYYNRALYVRNLLFKSALIVFFLFIFCFGIFLFIDKINDKKQSILREQVQISERDRSLNELANKYFFLKDSLGFNQDISIASSLVEIGNKLPKGLNTRSLEVEMKEPAIISFSGETQGTEALLAFSDTLNLYFFKQVNIDEYGSINETTQKFKISLQLK